ncbi:MAG: hypothetical protein ACTSVI_06995 [Promethearchaeota archaeon]
MTTDVNSLDILKGLVEKVIFSGDNLNLLKLKITQLSRDKITPKEMKQLILNQRATMLNEILELFPFFIKRREESDNSRTASSDINISDLEQKLGEREELLELVARRIQGLVQGNPTIERKEDSNFNDDTRLSIENIVIKELQIIDIDSWLKMFDYLDLEKKKVEDEFRLLIRLIGNIGLYHERVFEKDDKLPIPKKIKELKLPIELEKDLILLNKARNDAVHDGREIYEDDRLLMYDVFFRVLQFLLEYHVKEKVNTLISNESDKRIIYKKAREVLANYIVKRVSKTSWEHPQLRNLIMLIFP